MLVHDDSEDIVAFRLETSGKNGIWTFRSANEFEVLH